MTRLQGNDALKSVVSEFRDRRKSRVETYAEMLRELNQGPELSQEEKDTTFELFSAVTYRNCG